MNRKLSKYSYKHDLQYYTDERIIPNQDLVKETINYFTTGEGARAFKPLEILNLLVKQFDYLANNFSEVKSKNHFLFNLPFSDLEKHIFYGYLLKWFGGYPIRSMFNEDQEFALRLIESEFLSYPEETPEKAFCKADNIRRKDFDKLGTALTMNLNYGIDTLQMVETLGGLQSLKKTEVTFSQLFDECIREKIIENFPNEQVYLIEKTKYQFNFNVWLQENKGWEYGNEHEYQKCLTKDNLISFIHFHHTEMERINTIDSMNQPAFNVFNQKFNELRRQFRVKRKATSEDCEILHRLNEGDVIEYEPEYKTTIEAYTLLTRYYAEVYFEYEKMNFLTTYKSWNKHTVKAEIEEIEKFIAEASKISLTLSCKSYNTYESANWHHIYNRFMCGFYENLEVTNYPFISSIGNVEARVYGRYFLFYDYLKEKYASYANGLLKEISDIKNVLEIQFLNENDYRTNIEKKLASISNPMEKIECLRQEKEFYLRHLNDETLAASGLVSSKFNNETALFLDRWIEGKIAELKNEINLDENASENDFVISTIEDWLHSFTSNFSDSDYKYLIMCLETFFKTGNFPKTKKILRVKGRVNIKSIGWALNQIYRDLKQDVLTYDYLLFAKEHISAFSKVELSKTGFFECNMYKYFTTKT